MFLKFADWLTYRVLGLTTHTKIGEAIHFFIYDVLKILFLLFIIISIIAFLRSYIDNNKLRRHIEKQPQFIAHLLASIFGAITPFCSCSSIPIFIGFIEAKIPFGIAMSFIITSPMINEIAILVLAGIIGWKITVVYVLTGIFVGTLGGILMQKFGWSKYLQDYLLKLGLKTENHCSCSCQGEKEKLSVKMKFKESFTYAQNLIKKIWLFIVLGISVGALLHGYVPQEFFIKHMGTNNFFAVPLAVLSGIPLYADATTIIPIAQVLINKGAAIGTVLVFMMATVALSLPEMIILSKVMKKALIIRFIMFMFTIFTLVGYFYNFILK